MTQEANAAVISLEGVSRFYQGGKQLFGKPVRITALSDLNLAIEAGEIFGLVGESGSGKTTIARLIARLETPDQGSVLYKGRAIDRLSGRPLKQFRQKVQMIFQDPYQSLNPYQSVQSIVIEPLCVHGWKTHADRQAKVLQVLEQVGLTPPDQLLPRYPHQLSGGQRQRVAVARALVLDPEILIADEPTSMLDATISIQIYGILSDIQDRLGITMLFITHNLAAAYYLCNRIGVIYHGHIVEIGPAQSVITDPRHPYTQALLDALPRFGHSGPHPRFNSLRQTRTNSSDTDSCPFYARCGPADDTDCREKFPPMQEVGERHKVACFKTARGSRKANPFI
jgi:peptide/nickel transport system ATP-binding protein